MKELLVSMLSNFTLVTVIISNFTAQGIKVAIRRLQEGKWDFWVFFEAGGMPSSHSATVTSLTLAAGIQAGWNSALFTACLVLALIVIYDATGVRRVAGKQAEILNKMMDDIYSRRKEKIEKVRVILGHDPVEVLAGVSLAILVTLVTYYVYFIR
ncbi:hypothetical protein AMJ44_03375 [candidate division WOR-1 bacterium DG_54_3]|uniref:Acid phosphatase n=1 Tax=candidate division WOR-1 bacterium DG_54_3 TaxID=1703775 RepID=A0A0S7Y491_UNCSA|nr:MAG: hypothetical protein AMJ44_03375 [candidate division WOR-1 bacterium DG_54_3]